MLGFTMVVSVVVGVNSLVTAFDRLRSPPKAASHSIDWE